MTRSTFDPTGGDTEHSGSRNLGPQASDISHMPPDVADGVVEPEQPDDTIDMSPNVSPVPEADAPQESDLVDDLDSMMEGQPTDGSDAPQ